jgi:catechol 2,3-dioxygenase-like lactoylglutathione lyase family enzyme
MMIIDHLTISVSNFERSRAFYERALQPLGITVLAKYDGFAGMGKNRPQFWFAQGEVNKHKTHIAFVAENRAEVDAFYKAAMAAGGKDNGAPGLRTIYHPTYYGAFVFDPDGYNVEAVCHSA